MVAEVTISSKYQVVIPLEVRKQLSLKAGQKLRVVVSGQSINMVPEIPLSEMRGVLKGLDSLNIREEDDRI